MSVLVVDYGAIKSLNSTASGLARRLQNRIDDYDGIIRGVGSLPRSSSNLDNAGYFIKKKNEQYQSKINKINGFKNTMNNFAAQAQETDKRVANRITSQTREFKKANNIKTCPLFAIGATLKQICFPWTKTDLGRAVESWVEDGLRSAKYAIKDWYRNGGKYALNIILDIAIIVVIVAATIVYPPVGAMAWFFAGVGMFNAGSDLLYDVKAAWHYAASDNRAVADRLGRSGGNEIVQGVTGGIGYLVGGEEGQRIGSKIGSILHTGLTLASVGYSLGKDYGDFRKIFKTAKGSTWSKAWAGTKAIAVQRRPQMKNIFKLRGHLNRKLHIKVTLKQAQTIGKLVRLHKTKENIKGLLGFANPLDFKNTADHTKWEFKVPKFYNDNYKNLRSLYRDGEGIINKPTRIRAITAPAMP